MTKPSEVTVTFDEVVRFHELQEEAGTSTALAAFLAARVPDADTSEEYRGTGNSDDDYKAGATSAHNSLRAAVLRGPG